MVYKDDTSRDKRHVSRHHIMTFHFETLNHPYNISRDNISHFETVAGAQVIFWIPQLLQLSLAINPSSTVVLPWNTRIHSHISQSHRRVVA
jgi:hypothetical protein